MDIIEVISENIEAKDSASITKLVNYYIDESKNKFMLSTYLVNLYCTSYVNKNLWILREIGGMLSRIEKTTNKNELKEILSNFAILLTHQESKPMIMFKKDETYDTEKPRINRILFILNKEYSDLDEFREYIHTEAFSLLNALYNSMVCGCDLPDCFIIVRYFLVHKKKQLLISDHFKDIIDVLFLIILKYIETNKVPDEVKEFVVLGKDIYYYRCKSKDKLDRIHILFYILYVIIHRKAKFQQIEYKLEKPLISSHKKNIEYLYVLTKYDNDMIKIVKNDRYYSKITKKEDRTVTINDMRNMPDTSIDIKKI